MTDALNLAGIKLGNYRLHKIIGRGNMGVVYLATDEALLRPTAVKVLTWAPGEHDPEAWFLAEARSVATLNHPSVVQIYSVARHGPHRYIAMEYVEGVSADVMVTRHGPFSSERATEVIAQLAAALELAHAAGIVHRDIKPGNILIRNDGTAKLGDFGMAISNRHKAPTTDRAGTPLYLAPEIWRGEPATFATDLYALGATYYYLLTGRAPFEGSTIAALGAAHLRQDVVVPPGFADGAAGGCMRIIRCCMAKAAADRYGSAAMVEREARGLVRPVGSPVPAGPALGRSALGEADAGWQARDFQFEPFGELDPRQPPYRGPPFVDLRQELATRLSRPGTTLVIGGAPGSGRSVLARSALADHPGRGVYIDLGLAGPRSGGLVQRIAHALGGVASFAAGSSPELEGLLETLAAGARAGIVPLIVVDGVVAGTRAAADAAILARAARATRHFKLLVVGPIELAVEHGGPILASGALAVSPLAPRDVGAYLASWLRATRPSSAPPLLVTVDAALIAGHRAQGNLGQLNALARKMIARGGPILTSWDAWTVRDEAGRDGAGFALPPVRPAVWPPAEVLALINQRRVAAGLAQRRAPG